MHSSVLTDAVVALGHSGTPRCLLKRYVESASALHSGCRWRYKRLRHADTVALHTPRHAAMPPGLNDSCYRIVSDSGIGSC